MGRLLFREAVRKEQTRSAMGSIILIRPLSFGVLSSAALLISTIAFGFLAVAEYTRKASLAGSLVPASGTIRVVSPQSGLVRERNVLEGEWVAAGEPLIRLVDPRASSADGFVAPTADALAERRLAGLRRQRKETAAAARVESEAMAARIAGLESELVQLDGELEAVGAREELARLALARMKELERRGFVSPAQAQQREEDSLDVRSRLHAAARARLALVREIAGLRSAIDESRARSRAQLSALDAQLAAVAQEQVEVRAHADAVVAAPASGIVAALLAEPGQVVASGAGLLTLLPDGSPLQAHLFAPSRAVGFVRAGQEVLLRYPAFPFQKFGSHRARVLSVSQSAVSAAELGFSPPDGSREPLYRVKVELAAQTVTAYGRAEPLQAGMLVEADVLLDRRRLIEWVFEPLFSLAGRA